jgi:hypothetical protein
MNELSVLQQAVCNGSAPVSLSALACKQCATKIEKAIRHAQDTRNQLKLKKLEKF